MVVDVPGGGCLVLRIEVGKMLGIEDPARTLADALAATQRTTEHGAGTTIWLDVISEHLPLPVFEAIRRCEGMGLGLVVTHAGQSTHEPGSLLPESLRGILQKASRGGSIWHPLVQREVRATPYDT